LDLDTVGAVAGHSLGEYTALVAAAALTPRSGAKLVAARGDAMQAAADAHPGTMAAVLGLDPEVVARACAGIDGAWVANDNAPGQVVISGTVEGVDAAGQLARELGAKRVLPLAVGGAFHSPLMAPAADQLRTALEAADFQRAAVPVVANVDADAHQDGWPARLGAQLTSPVRWRQSLVTLAGLGVTHFLELGPGVELSGMVKRSVDGAARANVATPADLVGLPGFAEGTR
ncbi:MAG: ACP S-malonyltransferase, partial [Actinomycetota bacterium]|nr:ACP S-malonyltransferase [Actinomycetota bacterium]